MANRATRALHDPWGVVRRRITPGRPADPAQPAAAAPSPEPGPSPKPAPKPKAKPKAKARPRVIGLVEQFSRRAVVGWVSVPVGAPPVRVDLRLGKVTAASTWATAVVKSAEPDDTDDPDLDDDVPAEAVGVSLSAPDQDETAPSRQLPDLPGPSGERRNVWGEVRTFSFGVRGIWPYVKRSTRVSVGVAGKPLPIYGHGMFLRPERNGKESPAELQDKFDEGYVLSQVGVLQLSKKLDLEWQAKVARMYDRTRRIVADAYGYDVFFIYGTLLGAVREGGHIGHDLDLDAAFLSRHTDGPGAAQDLQDIAMTLIEHGLDVECRATALHIHDAQDPTARIDLFHLFFDDEGHLGFPFGVAGSTTVSREDWRGTEEIDFPGGRGLIPCNAEQMVEHIYGADWRKPKPGFNWKLDRTANAKGATVLPKQRSKVYWANFYSRTEYTSGSTFAAFVDARPDTPRFIIDVGCGDGRDACAFAAAGRTVLGLDQSAVGVEHAAQHAEARGVAERASFSTCDVADAERFTALVEQFRATAGDEPVMFYLRFFLHSIPVDTQDQLMEVIRASARQGDQFAAEFRTDKDEDARKVHGKHYRRFQNGAAFGRSLQERYAFTIVHEEESTGLSPYRNEDPVLYRVLARR